MPAATATATRCMRALCRALAAVARTRYGPAMNDVPIAAITAGLVTALTAPG